MTRHKKKIAIVLTHPIQYYVPIFIGLQQANKFDIMVFYSGGKDMLGHYDPEFKQNVKWNIPLTEGYPFTFCENDSKNPGTDKFNGVAGNDVVFQIENFNPDAILIFGYAYQSHLRVLKHFKNKIPIVFRGDSHLLNRTNVFRRLIKWLYLRYIFSYVDYALYVGSANKEYYISAGLKEDQLFFVPHAIDDSRFIERNIDLENELKLKYNILNIDRVLIYVGKIDLNKNIHTLIQAFNSIDNQNLKLIIVGTGVNYDHLRSLNTNNRIYFTGFVNQFELPSYYHISDCLVLPSYSETWGLVINEAMSAGLTVIASNKVGSAQDLILEGKNGYTFDPDNSIQLKDKINLVFNNDLSLQLLKSSASSHIKQFSMGTLISSLINSLEQVLNEK